MAKKLFMARKAEVEFVTNAKLVDSKEITRKRDNKKFLVGVFELEDGTKADIVFPNGWEPLGFDMYFDEHYTGGWQEGDQEDENGNKKHLFTMRPADLDA